MVIYSSVFHIMDFKKFLKINSFNILQAVQALNPQNKNQEDTKKKSFCDYAGCSERWLGVKPQDGGKSIVAHCALLSGVVQFVPFAPGTKHSFHLKMSSEEPKVPLFMTR